MTHSEVSRERHNFGDLTAETLEIDISALDSTGTETSVSPAHIDDIKGVAAHLVNSQETGHFSFGYNETSNELFVFNESAGAQAANNAAVNNTQITFWGSP